MPFSLKNARPTYQRYVNKFLMALIRKTMEVYLDNVITKSVKETNHMLDLKEIFRIRGHYGMKLNPKKCPFKVRSKKFSGYMIDRRGIKANPNKVALLNMKSPTTVKEVKKFKGAHV